MFHPSKGLLQANKVFINGITYMLSVDEIQQVSVTILKGETLKL